MHTGMMWWGDPKKPLSENVEKAAAYYTKKYGRTPDLCLVHPSMMTGTLPEGITIRPYRPVLPGHLWIGVEDKS